ncbi:hypothetical protein Clacol_007677 [Clathrus columnatus]|uniref:Uncharacterized protein n=1 Tax=Clathrus columnatus TaxID=1419009 RepID=A0AAV5AL51_9AGAM|nr:hypothetical protein Clacol_007677 [Clathrus columnatus]
MGPCIVLACQLARARPDSVIVTIPVAGEFQTMVDKEIDRCLSSEEKDLKQNFHVINLGGKGRDAVKLVPIILGGFESFYSSLHALAPIKCATGHVHNFERAPDVVVADVVMLDGLHTIRKLSQHNVPILSLHPASLGPAMRLIGPEDLGGIGFIEPKAKELAEKTGKLYDEAELEVKHDTRGISQTTETALEGDFIEDANSNA